MKKIQIKLNKKQRQLREKIVAYILVVICSVFFIVPLLWMLLTALKSTEDLANGVFFPTKLVWSNFVTAVKSISFAQYTFNSLYYATFSTIGMVISTTLTSYAFGKLKWPGRDKWFLVMIATMVIPSQVLQIPLFILYSKLGWIDTYNPLIIPSYFAVGAAANIFLLRQFFMGIPNSLKESAQLDGANEFQVFYKIIIPLAMPQLAVIFLFSFIATYSEYVITSIFLQTPGKMTLALGLQSFISDQFAAHWTLFSAAAVISSLPIMIVFMCLQRFIQNGLVAGGVKG